MELTDDHIKEGHRERILILGAAGRDFHVFNTVYRCDRATEVVAFTATQIPGIANRLYPPELAGPLYPKGIYIYPEEQLEELIKKLHVDRCVLAYSDLSAETVVTIMCRIEAAEADFCTLCPKRTFLHSSKPVLAVTAVRTGCGKSQVSGYCIDVLHQHGIKTVLVRHPMPYGDLKAEAVQRFSTYNDLHKHKVTIEEREEYEQHIAKGTVVYAGVDYEAILRQAEKEAEVVIWDGGNNDTPFYQPGLWICVADPLRVGHELTYFPGNVNFAAADVIDINKANTGHHGAVKTIMEHARQRNPKAGVVVTDSVVTIDEPDLVRGKRVVTIDDGPTLTHGGAPFGAGKIAAEEVGATVVDPHPYAVGTLKETFKKFPHIRDTVPAMGYSPQQIKDLEETLNRVPADAVLVATPIDLGHLVKLNKPYTRVRYAIRDRADSPHKLSDFVERFIQKELPTKAREQ